MSRAAVRHASEIVRDPRFLDDDHESSHSAQTVASKTRVLEAMRHKEQETGMLREGIEEATGEMEPAPKSWAPEHRPDARPDWRTVDRALRAIRQSRAALDAEEMHWLREAEALQIWRPLGTVSALDSCLCAAAHKPRARARVRAAHRPGPAADRACAGHLAAAQRRARW